ncbi:MAG TPA: MarR family transcriptional regulator [Acidimicrobiia bacterium]|nr:MarR family transcriptional regulator [Acidimicrobiia bacterium]
MRTATAPQPVELASRFRLVAMRLSRRLRQQSTGGITPAQLSALATLVRDGRHTTGDLAAAERVQPPTITRVVDSLVDAALVARVADPTDRRVTWVEATPAGRALVEAVRRERDAYLAQRLRTLSPGDLATIDAASTILERLLAEEPR